MSPPTPSDDLAPLDERGRAFLHRARGLRGLAPHQLARIARRLKEQRPARRRWALSRALAAIAVVLMAGAAAAWASGTLAQVPGLKALFGRTAPRPAATAETPTPEATAPGPGVVPALGPAPAVSETAPPAVEARTQLGASPAGAPARPVHRDQQASVRRPGSSRHRASVATTPLETTSPERSEDSIVLEGRSLAAALELWRAREDVPAALAALDQHDRRFPDGQMRVEARALRAEILLAARREAEALAVLDRLPLDQVPRGRELRTLRGELRVRLDRCDEGRSDLQTISRGADALATRARAALAQCP